MPYIDGVSCILAALIFWAVLVFVWIFNTDLILLVFSTFALGTAGVACFLAGYGFIEYENEHRVKP